MTKNEERLFEVDTQSWTMYERSAIAGVPDTKHKPLAIEIDEVQNGPPSSAPLARF